MRPLACLLMFVQTSLSGVLVNKPSESFDLVIKSSPIVALAVLTNTLAGGTNIRQTFHLQGI